MLLLLRTNNKYLLAKKYGFWLGARISDVIDDASTSSDNANIAKFAMPIPF